MSHLSDPCFLGQHASCKSPYCQDTCGCRERQGPVKQGDSGRIGAIGDPATTAIARGRGRLRRSQQ